MKKERTEIRICPRMKAKWVMKAAADKSSLSEFIILRVEEKLSLSEIKAIEKIAENVINRDALVENNINQFAKNLNTDNRISDRIVINFTRQLRFYTDAIKERNKNIAKLYKHLYP